ncbi:SigE family RNA polymerase sigma factor [Luteipulveratus mongoliensis]|uniref:RNA polymerase subunit sigma-24 n=1 Tax=Luteipulveratus mongoliensis TaxID=571913 RepID=A0A0K1JM88_9MICO|nr:SigE family RNA polymerase sigma factor [Luteipulveratus mongoliensis]AKU17829.1 hypothetical protein VV02_21490 [Luteipulveratus mongoliensis]
MRSATDPEAATYVTAAYPRLMNLAGALTGNRHDAQDLVQDTMATVLIKWHKVRAATNQDAYVRRVLVNRYVSKKRLRSASEIVSHDAVTRDRASEPLVDIESRDEMMELLWRLPRVQRTVLVLRFYEDLSDAQIAQTLSCREGTVRSNASRALASLREELGSVRACQRTDSAQAPLPASAG